MINLKNNHVEWAMLSYELDDAIEHLQGLVNDMNQTGEIDIEDFEIQLGVEVQT